MYRFKDFRHPGKPTVLAFAIGCSLTTVPGHAQTFPSDLANAISQLTTEVCDPAGFDQWPASFTVVMGSEGRDNIRVPNDGSQYVVYGLGGNDTIRGSKQSDVLCGGDDNDRIYGQQGGDYIGGGEGRDRLYGGRDDDVIHGGEDNDRINGGSGSDVISAGTGDDYAYGSSGDDIISGDEDDDRLYGNSGDDDISGGAGFDNAQGGAGIDRCTGAEVGSCELELSPDTDSDGYPDDEDNCPTDPNPDQADNYGGYSGDACEDSDDDGTYDVDETDICISVAGAEILQVGTAYCHSDPVPGLVAIANGDYALAEACNGFYSSTKKKASKTACSYVDEELDLSWASAGDVVAEALGMGATAYATDGAGKLDDGIPAAQARAVGVYAGANAFGSDSSADATGESAYATATGIGNSAIAIGQYSDALARGIGNAASASGYSSDARVYGENSEATADGEGADARAGDYEYYFYYTEDGTLEFNFDTVQSNNIARAIGDNTEATAVGGEVGCTAIAPDGDGNLIVSCGEIDPEP